VVDENDQAATSGGADFVLGAVAGEHDALGVGAVDVQADRAEGVPVVGEHGDVDTAVVVAVDELHVREQWRGRGLAVGPPRARPTPRRGGNARRRLRRLLHTPGKGNLAGVSDSVLDVPMPAAVNFAHL
jgi:GNAT superfamily N-acetyltransferase